MKSHLKFMFFNKMFEYMFECMFEYMFEYMRVKYHKHRKSSENLNMTTKT